MDWYILYFHMHYKEDTRRCHDIQLTRQVRLVTQLYEKVIVELILRILFLTLRNKLFGMISCPMESNLHRLHELRGSPVYPGKQIHFAEWYPGSQIAFEPQYSSRHASMQLPLLHFSDLWQSLSISHSAFTSTVIKRYKGYKISSWLKVCKHMSYRLFIDKF